MTPAQVAKIMALVERYSFLREHGTSAEYDKAGSAVEAALRDAPQQAEVAESVNETNAVLAGRYFDLLKVVEAYEKHGVTCQTFRHFIDTPCAECNSAPQQAEPCFCDRNNIGEPGVSCGDCPTRDYKQSPSAPQQAEGWVSLDRELVEQAVEVLMEAGLEDTGLGLHNAMLAARPSAPTAKPLFAEMIAQHPGLREEIAAEAVEPDERAEQELWDCFCRMTNLSIGHHVMSPTERPDADQWLCIQFNSFVEAEGMRKALKAWHDAARAKFKPDIAARASKGTK